LLKHILDQLYVCKPLLLAYRLPSACNFYGGQTRSQRLGRHLSRRCHQGVNASKLSASACAAYSIILMGRADSSAAAEPPSP